MQNSNPREVALKILYRINEDKAYLNITLDNSLKDESIKPIDRTLITELVNGVTRWRLTLDYIIEQFSQVKFKRISPWILNILRLGVYQLMFMDKIPVPAACDESVKLAKKYGHTASAGYVNGVLRNIGRNIDNIKYPDKNNDLVNYLSIKYSFPEWMVSRWIKRYGEDFAIGFMDHSNKLPPVTIGVNNLKTTISDLKNMLTTAGILCKDGKYANGALLLENAGCFVETSVFKNGYFQVQDESSMLAAEILEPLENEIVVDVCSAPGGKATHIAELMNNRGVVIARDIHEHKIKLVEQAAQRLGTDIVKPELHSALVLDEALVGKADRVIIDAPCTGLGIIRRKPDIKWLRTETQARDIVNIQCKMLEICSMYLKPGGVLVYSTCTIEPEENVDVFDEFLKNHDEFSPVDFRSQLPKGLIKPTAEKGYIQLYPNTDGTDGFFIAKARRTL